MGAELTVRQKILMAAVSLGTEKETFSVEELIVKSWTTFPESFSLRGYYAKYPDSNRVLAKLSGTDGLCGLGWLEHTDQRMYRLTRKGRVLARQLAAMIAESGVSVPEMPANDAVEVTPEHPVAAPVAAPVKTRPAPAAKPARATKKSAGEGARAKAEAVVEAEPPKVEAIPLSAEDAYSINLIAKGDALRKFLRGSPLTFNDGCAFWSISTTMLPQVVSQRLDATEGLLKRAVESFGSEGPQDSRIPPLSTCYGLLNLHKLMLGKFARELDTLRLPLAAG